MIDPDTVGRIAIRLGRAYMQGWAKAIPSDVKWNWETAEAAVRNAKTNRPPKVVGDTIRFDNADSSTSWLISPTEVRVIGEDRIGGVQTVVEAQLDGAPRVVVTAVSLAALKESAIWRADRALTSVCAGPWQSLHRLTPLTVIVQALPEYIPTEPARLTYEGDRIRCTYAPLDEAMARLGCRFFTRWGTMVMR